MVESQTTCGVEDTWANGWTMLKDLTPGLPLLLAFGDAHLGEKGYAFPQGECWRPERTAPRAASRCLVAATETPVIGTTGI